MTQEEHEPEPQSSELSPHPDAHRILGSISSQQAIDDKWFDQLYPDWAGRLSRMHWTPVRVALRAAELLAPDSRARVLDIGSGVGKFCMIGALSTRGRFTGIEQRPRFAELARRVMHLYHVPRVTFFNRNLTETDFKGYNSFYLFNPFQEHLLERPIIDDSVTLSRSLHERYVQEVCSRLREAPIGSRVVTYHGLGGTMPESFKLEHREPGGTAFIDLWVKKN